MQIIFNLPISQLLSPKDQNRILSLIELLLLGSHGSLLSKFLDHALYTLVELIWYIKGCKLVDIETTFSLSEECFVV